MMVRRYVVKDMPEAVLLIRKDLGKDAVILSTKKITLTKWMGLLRTKRIEVLASTGDDIPMRAPIPQFQPAAQRFDAVSGGADRAGFTPLTATSESNRPHAQSSAGKMSVSVATADSGTGYSGASVEAREAFTARTEAAAGTPNSSIAAFAVAPEMPASEDLNTRPLSEVWKELSEMRRLLETSVREKPLVPRSKWIRHLIAHGVSEDDATVWLEEAKARVSGGNPQATDALEHEEIRTSLQTVIMEQLQRFRSPSPISLSSRVIAFVGPTGVGKTTTVAKVAALHVLGGKRRVGLVTTDTFRIAAVDQLRTYSSILNVPLEVVYQPSDLPVALERLSGCDLVLIDTAGRNFLMDAYLEEVSGLFSAAQIDETYLVLSLTAKLDDLNRVAQSFRSLPVSKFLFTKLDETTSIGSVLSLLRAYQWPLTYMTTGQNVPDDIEIASLERVLEMVLGEETV